MQSVRRSIFSGPTVALVSFITLSKGYYRSESFSRFLHRLLNLPRLGIRRNASGTSGGRLSFSKDKRTPLYIHTHTHTHAHAHMINAKRPVTLRHKFNIKFPTSYRFQMSYERWSDQKTLHMHGTLKSEVWTCRQSSVGCMADAYNSWKVTFKLTFFLV